jgi:isoquinoline 1-oxidoreductase beta subunit
MTRTLDEGRRRFLQTSAAAASGLVIGFYLPSPLRGPLAALAQAPPGPRPLPAPNAFLHISPDDTITIRLAHSEMGQGIWTTLAMLVAEELECDWAKVRVEHAPVAPAYAHTVFGLQMTGGSTTTWSEFERYRQVGAMAREMLVKAAADRWGVPVSECRAARGNVIHGDRRLSYGALSEAAMQGTPPGAVQLKPASAWTIVGKPTKRLDAPEKVTGRARFGIDVQFPGLMTAVVERAPVFGGKLKRFSGDRAMKVPGVKAVVQVPSGVAVVGEHFWAAQQGREALEIEWDEGTGARLDTATLREEFRAMSQKTGARAASTGDVVAATGSAASRFEAEYEGPYLAHATMEPLNCTVRLAPDKCEIWTGTQFQGADQLAAAQAAGLKPEQVEIHTSFLGGGFGRRANPVSDFIVEAVHVAKASEQPVKVVWTREDDIRGGYYRPMWHHRVRAGLDSQGRPTAWHHTIVCQSIIEGTPFAAALIKDGIDGTSVEGASDSPYLKSIANHLVELHSPRLPVTTLWWRSVGHTHTGFVMESAIDELAHVARQDPVEYRRKLLAGHARHLGVLDLAAEKAGWGTPLPAGRARGVAVHESFGSFVAEVAEVSVESGRIRVHRVVSAIDCGVCVNPEGVRAQIESAIVYGLSAALGSEITLKNGRVQQSNFHDYDVLRFDAMPRVEVHIAPSTERPGGAGEPGTPPVAPAVANAVFALTGKRLRRLPFRLT